MQTIPTRLVAGVVVRVRTAEQSCSRQRSNFSEIIQKNGRFVALIAIADLSRNLRDSGRDFLHRHSRQKSGSAYGQRSGTVIVPLNRGAYGNLIFARVGIDHQAKRSNFTFEGEPLRGGKSVLGEIAHFS